jgi:hypothetical protein
MGRVLGHKKNAKQGLRGLPLKDRAVGCLPSSRTLEVTFSKRLAESEDRTGPAREERVRNIPIDHPAGGDKTTTSNLKGANWESRTRDLVPYRRLWSGQMDPDYLRLSMGKCSLQGRPIPDAD